jgi:recombinational DNA repair protein (RecF pathway)
MDYVAPPRLCCDCKRPVGVVGVRVGGVGLLCRTCYAETTAPPVPKKRKEVR